MILLLIPLAFAAPTGGSTIVTPQGASIPVPPDVPLKAGENLARIVPSGDPRIPSAYVIHTRDEKVVIAWKGARTAAYDAIVVKPETGEELIKFIEGSLLFRVIRSGKIMFTVQVIEREEFGIGYLMADEESRLWLTVAEEEILCHQAMTSGPWNKFWAILPKKRLILFFAVNSDGARVDTWVHSY